MRRDRLSENRDFILSLDPTVVYQVSQLWTALEKRDGNQWSHFLDALAGNLGVRSASLRKARASWQSVLAAQRPEWLQTMGVPSEFRQAAVLARSQALFDRRLEAYARLLPLTEYGPPDQPRVLGREAREDIAKELRSWFYKEGAGLLLSGRALEQFNLAYETLREAHPKPAAVREQLSRLRTDLKIDLGIRQPQERDVPMSWPEDERW